ncbi:hypothetical protein NKG05_11915 [Oerskovia sp. M15]
MSAFAGRGSLTMGLGESRDERWVSIDLVDGSERWDEQFSSDAWNVLALDGRLYGLDGERIIAFG